MIYHTEFAGKIMQSKKLCAMTKGHFCLKNQLFCRFFFKYLTALNSNNLQPYHGLLFYKTYVTWTWLLYKNSTTKDTNGKKQTNLNIINCKI